MSEQTEFGAEYVTKLREEAASWRVKYRELEDKQLYNDVKLELMSKGIEADPSWVTIKEGQTVTQAVDDLAKDHPNLVKTSVVPETTNVPVVTSEKRIVRPQGPRVMTTESSSTEVPANPLHDRSLAEIKKDPVARAKLRDIYRAALAASSNQPIDQF